MEVKYTQKFLNSLSRLTDWYWAPFRWLKAVKRFPKEVKWVYQRATRGWADCDVWSFDSYIAEVISGATKRLADIAHGAPGDMFDPAAYGADGRIVNHELHDQGFQNWKDTLNKISEGFAAVKTKDDMEYENDIEAWRAKQEALDNQRIEASNLFTKHFHSLWD